MKLAWLTDIHLDFFERSQKDEFYNGLKSRNLDGLLISGDIGTSNGIDILLEEIANELLAPIYFVLGNHDFYFGSMADVREKVKQVCRSFRNIHYLTDSGIIRLTNETTLIGHDSWADGRFGDYITSDVMLNDYFLIKDLADLSKAERFRIMNSLGDEAAKQLEINLPLALEGADTVIFVTHVPPFREACWYEGKISGDDFLPHFSCKAVGDVLHNVMKMHPSKKLIVLCGHTHSAGKAGILDNLIVHTGGAVYGAPKIQKIFDFD